MRSASEVMADLAAAGLAPQQMALVMELALAAAIEARPTIDVAAERRRAKDRDRKRGIPQISAEDAESAGSDPSPPPPSPRPPTTPTPTRDKGTTREGRATRFCPADWLPSPEDHAFALAEGFSPGEIDRHLAQMKDHQFRDAHTRWGSTFRNWIRRAAQDRRPPSKAPANDRQPARQDRRAEYSDRLSRIDAAMAAAVEQSSG